MYTFTVIQFFLLFISFVSSLNSTTRWDVVVLTSPTSPRAGSLGIRLNASTLAFFGGVPDPAKSACAVSSAQSPVMTTLKIGAGGAPAGAITFAAPEAALPAPLSTETGTAAAVPSSATSRVVSLITTTEGLMDVQLWDSSTGFNAPISCTPVDTAAAIPAARAGAGLAWITNCNTTVGGVSASCFVLYGGVLSAGGAVVSDMWFLWGADVTVASAARCAWSNVPSSSRTGSALPPLAHFVTSTDAAHTEVIMYGGILDTVGSVSEAVFRFSPLGFADATEDEMDNIALPHDNIRPTAWQSTLAWASLGWGNPLPAGLAIDNGRDSAGDIVSAFFTSPNTALSSYVPATPPSRLRSCTHSAPNDPYPWWGVDLGAMSQIDAIKIFQRTDCCRGRFAGFAIFTSSTNATSYKPGALPWVDGASFPMPYADLMQTSVFFRSSMTTKARYVYISLSPGKNRLLTLCEVQVYRKRTLVVRNLGADVNVALGKETFSLFGMFPTKGGANLPNTVVDGLVVPGSPAASYASIKGATGATAASQTSLTPYLGVDLGAVYDLGSGPSGRTIVIYPSNLLANGNTRVSVSTGHTRDFNYMTRCWGPGTLAASVGVIGNGGYFTLPQSCAGTARYIIISRSLVNSPALDDMNTLNLNEVQAWAMAQGSIKSGARYGAASARFGSMLYVFGGINSMGTVLGDLQILDLTSFSWILSPVPPLGSAPSVRAYASLVVQPPEVGFAATAPSRGLALFGGRGTTGLLGDVMMLDFTPCAPLSSWGAQSITCDETNTVCTVVCLPTWKGANPGSNNILTCGSDGTWGLSILPPCSGVVSDPPASVTTALVPGFDASGHAVTTVTFTSPPKFAYEPWGSRAGWDNAGGDLFLPPLQVAGGPDFCWDICNKTVGCLAYAYDTRYSSVGNFLTPSSCWLKKDVKAWNIANTYPGYIRTSGDLPNPLIGYRLKAVPAGQTDFFAKSSLYQSNITFYAGSSIPQTPSALYTITDTVNVGSVVSVLPSGVLALDAMGGAKCSWTSGAMYCLQVLRPWPEAIVPSTSSWAVETYISTPPASQRSLQALQTVGLVISSTTGPLVYGGIQGSSFLTRNIVFGPTTATGISPSYLRTTPYTPTSAFLRIEYSATSSTVRLGFREKSTDVWSFLPSQPATGTSAVPGGGSLGLGQATLRVGFIVHNPQASDLRAYAEVGYLRITSLAADATCPSTGPALVTSLFNYLGPLSLPLHGLAPLSSYTVSAEALTTAGWGAAKYSTTPFTVPARLPPPGTSVVAIGKLGSLAPRVSNDFTTTSTAFSATYRVLLTVDGSVTTGFLSSGTGVYSTLPGERLTLSLGQYIAVQTVTLTMLPVSVYGTTLDLQVIVHDQLSDWTSGAQCSVPSVILGGTSVTLNCFPAIGSYLTLRSGMSYNTSINGGGHIAIAEIAVNALNLCPAVTTAYTTGSAGCSGGTLNTTCTLSCLTNYVPLNGISIVTCTGTAWSGQPLSCAPACNKIITPNFLDDCKATIFFDAFDYTDSAGSVEAIVATPTGALWMPLDDMSVATSWGGAWNLASGRLNVDSLECAAGHVMVASSNTLASAVRAAVSVSIIVDVTTTAEAGIVWGAVYYNKQQNYYRAGVSMISGSAASGGSLFIVRVLGGTVTLLASRPVPLVLPGVSYTLNLTVTDFIFFSLTLNGAYPLLSSDASSALSGTGNVGMYSSTQATFDNFAVVTSCFDPADVTRGATLAATAGTEFLFSCQLGFQSSFTPFKSTCVGAGASASWYPATMPACTLTPPIFYAQSAYVAESSERGDLVGPDPLKGSLSSPYYSIEWTLGAAVSSLGAPWMGGFTLSSCTGQLALIKDNITSPAFRPSVPTGVNGYLSGTINVTAGVSGFSGTSTSQLIPIVIIPQDQVPLLYSSTLTIPENSLGGLIVGAPSFFDWDTTWNVPAWSTYSWAWADASSGLLMINNVTGSITVTPNVRAGQLNYETLAPMHNYGQITRITEVNNSLYSSSATITIALSDMNDPPTIPTGQIITAFETDAYVGAGIGILISADEDTGVFMSSSTFSIVSPVDVAAYNMSYRYNDISCDTMLYPTIDGTLTGSPLFSASSTSSNLTVAATVDWSTRTAFVAPNNALVRGAFRVCLNATDAFGSWGIGPVDVLIMVSSSSNVPSITSWSCTGPSFVNENMMLPTMGGVSGDLCTLVGSNFYVTALSVSLVLPGPNAVSNVINCPSDPACVSVSSTSITIVPPAGVGAGLTWFVLSQPLVGSPQQAFDLSNTLVAYVAPVVNVISSAPSLWGTMNTMGGDVITITGENFGQNSALVNFTWGLAYAPFVCSGFLVAQTSISCTTPPGVGRDLAWTLTVAGQIVSSGPQNSITYTPPLFTSVRVVDAVSNAIYDVQSLARGANASTTGGSTVFIGGTNFGSAPTWLVSTGPDTSLPLVSCVAPTAWAPGTPCWSFQAPAGVGAGLTLSVFAGNQPATIPWSFNAPVVFSLVPTVTPSSLPIGSIGFPTTGGVLLNITGLFFGSNSFASVSVSFGIPSVPLEFWQPCGYPDATSSTVGISEPDTVLQCMLPEGSGALLSVAVTVTSNFFTVANGRTPSLPVTGITPAVFSYDRPVVFTVASSSSVSPPMDAGATFSILRGPAAGGTVLTLTGMNFGAAKIFVTYPLTGTSAFDNCAFLTWRQSPDLATKSLTCNGAEDWVGEGEVAANSVIGPGYVLNWSHTSITLQVPPGLGQKMLQLSINGANATSETIYFTYDDPVVTKLELCPDAIRDPTCMGATTPVITGTDGYQIGFSGTLLKLSGLNFGPTPLNMAQTRELPYIFQPPPELDLSSGPRPLPLALAPYLIMAYPIISSFASCSVPVPKTSLGTDAPAYSVPVLVGPPVSLRMCAPVVVSLTDSAILFYAPAGIGIDVNVSVTIVSGPTAAEQQSAAPPTLLFSYAPPVITGFAPSVIALNGLLPATIVIYGNNFGTDDGIASAFWTYNQRVINGSLVSPTGSLLDGGAFVATASSDESCVRTRQRDVSRGNVLRTVIMCGVNINAARAGFGNIALTVAGQRTTTVNVSTLNPPSGYVCDPRNPPSSQPLVFVCSQGYFAHSGETCLSCPTYDENPSLIGADCETPAVGTPPVSPDPYNFLWPCWLQPVSGQSKNISVDNFASSFLYPRPRAGWFDLSQAAVSWSIVMSERGGERLTADRVNMAAACPQPKPYGSYYDSTEFADYQSRDVCIVPCLPASACLGENKCALGYISTPPSFRCATCDISYFVSAGYCIKCPDSPTAVIVLFLLFIGFIAVAGYYFNKHQVNVAMISIGVDFFQVLAIFADARIAWPPEVLALLRLLRAFNFNIEIVAPECLVPNVTYPQKFLAVILFPVILGSVLFLSWALQYVMKLMKGQTEKRTLHSHTPMLISSLLIIMYLLYLYLTRTALDVLNCAPPSPDDGHLYLQVVFEDCAKPGGIFQTYWPLGVLALLLFSCGYPFVLARHLWRNRELVMEDQLLRAKGVGDDRLSNPHALELRHTWGRTYYQFKPDFPLWALVVIARKFGIALTSIIFNRSVNFQMAACLLIMFLAYTAQVQMRPYMSPGDADAVIKSNDARAIEGDTRQQRLRSNIAGILSRGRKTGRKNVLTPSGKISVNALAVAIRDYAFNFNTVEATMIFCIVIVCLMALMYQSSGGTAYNAAARTSITWVLMCTIVFAILYFVAALAVEVANTRACGKPKSMASKRLTSPQSAIAMSGPIDAQMNPLFLRKDGSASLGSQESLIATLLAQEDAPAKDLWKVFRVEFATTLETLNNSQAELLDVKTKLQRGHFGRDDNITGALPTVTVKKEFFAAQRSAASVRSSSLNVSALGTDIEMTRVTTSPLHAKVEGQSV